MSKTADLDATITTLQGWLETEKTQKGKLAVADRLIRALALKYKHSDDGKGGKFAPQPEPVTNGASHAGNEPSH
jgi:hypothetical protein